MARVHVVALSIAVSLPLSPAVDSPQEAIRYELQSESWFGEVCELCDCPDVVAELRGTFVLIGSGESEGFQTFDLREVEWRTRTGSQAVAVTGSGSFRHGGPAGRRQVLELDLRVGGQEMHFASAPADAEVELPRLAIRAETHLKPTCRDTVLFLVARPEPQPPSGGQADGDRKLGATGHSDPDPRRIPRPAAGLETR